MKKLILLLLFIPLIFSCSSSEEIDEPEVDVDSPVLVKSINIRYGDTDVASDLKKGQEKTIEFSYLGSKINTAKSPYASIVSGQVSWSEMLYTYEYDEDKISKFTQKIGSVVKYTYEFQYNDDRLSKYTFTRFNDDGTVKSNDSFNVQWETDYLSNTVFYDEVNPRTFSKHKFDSQNNLIQIENYGTIFNNGVGTYRKFQTTDRKCDTNKNPFYNITGASQLTQIDNLFANGFIGNGKNNYTESNENYNIFEEFKNLLTSSYQYNSEGYPSTVVYTKLRDHLDGSALITLEKNTYTFNY